MINEKILITGGNGFLGKSLCEKLEPIANIIAPRSRILNLLDLQNTLQGLAIIKPTMIIHLAATVGGIGANRNNPGRFFYENLQMGLNILEASRLNNVKKLLITGTVCSYPKFTEVPFKEENIWKGFPEETNAPYGIAKKSLLIGLQAYKDQYGMNSCYLLPVNMYGPRDNFDLDSSHVIPAMIRKFIDARNRKAKTVTLWGTGGASREFLYVDDCADAIVKALQLIDSPTPINIGTGNEITMRDLADLIKKLTKCNADIVWDTSMPDGQPRRCLSTDKAKELLNWQASTTLTDGLKKTIQWYEANEDSIHNTNR